MKFYSASSGSLAAFVLIVLGVIAAFLWAIYHSALPDRSLALRRAIKCAIGLALWLGLLGAVVRNGFVSDQPMPRLLVAFATVNLVSLAAVLSPIGRWLIEGSSIRTLVLFQAFRLPLELVLHNWAARGTIPEEMTWTGSNWDILTGIVALAAAPWAHRSRALAWFANLLGLALLVNVMRVAVLSSPLPFAWPLETPLQLAFHFPYALIVPVCVGGALIGHVVLTRALLRR